MIAVEVTTPLAQLVVQGGETPLFVFEGRSEVLEFATNREGIPGTAATVAVGTVTTGDPGTDASVTNSGTPSAAVLDFVIPRGDAGADGAGFVCKRHDFSADLDGDTGPFTIPVTAGYDIVALSERVVLDGTERAPGHATGYTLTGADVTLATAAYAGQTLWVYWMEVPQ